MAASCLTNYLEHYFLRLVFKHDGCQSQTITPYISLHTGVVTLDDITGPLFEVVGANYGRVSQPTANWGVVGSSATLNALTTFNQATSSWGSVRYYGVWDASISSNMLFFGSVTAITVLGSQTAKINAAQIRLDLT